MYNANQVREAVRETFRELGASPAELAEFSESLLVQDGQYFGRTYRAAALMAMWMADVHLIQFYDAEGQMLKTLDLSVAEEPQRKAA